MIYSQDLIDEIKSSNDIVDIVSEYVKLKRAGKYYKGLCPFHKEKTPSFSVSPDKQIFYCFGCGMGGDAIRFISKIENIDFGESVEVLADRANIKLPENDNNIDYERIKQKERLYEINKLAAKYFYNNLFLESSKQARDYLEKRKIDVNVVKRFGIGYSINNSTGLYKYLLEQGYTADEMLKVGLVNKKDNDYYDKFRNRIMFPIFDIRDRIIGFGGRVLDDSLPKYMNSPESMIYSKGKNLYAMNLAKRTSKPKIIIVEGYLDAISLQKSGFSGAIASLGTALTENQGRLIRKYTEEVYIGYDSDGAGQNATLRGLEILASLGLNVKIIQMEGAKDPDEYINKFGKEKFEVLINNALSLVEFKIKLLKKDIDITRTEGKIEFLNKMAYVLSKIENSIEQDAYVKKMAREIGIGAEAIYSEINKIKYGKDALKSSKFNIKGKLAKADENEKNEISEARLKAERMIIFLLASDDPNVYKFLKKEINFDKFKVKLYANLAEKIYSNDRKLNIVDLFTEENEINAVTGILQEEANDDINQMKLAEDLVVMIKKDDLEEQKKILLGNLKERDKFTADEIVAVEKQLNYVVMELNKISSRRR